MRGEYGARRGETLGRRGIGGVAAEPCANHPENEYEPFHVISPSPQTLKRAL
jgi:hypothetical protein